MKEACLWHETSPELPLRLSSLETELTSDVAIIGGGITGLSTAIHLAESGVSVSLIESHDIPNGGSGRNVGLVNAGLWIPPDDIVDILGAEKGERATRILGGAPAEVFSLIDRYQIQCHATRTGTLHLAHNAKGELDLTRRFAQLESRGAPVEIIEDERCYQAVGTRRIRRALLDRRAGTVNPAAYTRGLARAALSLGVKIYTNTPATGVTRPQHDWVVTTPKGRIKASKVVMATNAYTNDDWNQVKQHFFPGYYFQVASSPLSDRLANEILPGKQGAWDTRMVLSSIRRDADGRLILGSLGQGQGRPEAYIRGWADRIQHHYFPQLGKVNWECTWSGRIAFTPEHTLRIWELAPGLLSVTGYNGRGITTGTIVGKGFAHYITHNDDSLLPLPIENHRPVQAKAARSFGYEAGFTLYHTGQCMRVLV
ncbi:NAD(P)/FAD-dependent oxidoreductase [Nitrincola nitratireducens]|uniref:Gamma-glutamylputrescine oxidoreductase n=1 Tax=Nitrincola nitratireducens TaxID=1229521 RepID=W9UZ01_9GAMM|nr:FAD-binding oxidoreductase [Nitrincola nitratireducens]EXJ12463.1 Gamma-glutamylputrescine oxidoreductase [Nitrincola nitratireducens]